MAKALTPLRAIRAKCIECSNSFMGVNRCDNAACPLFFFRLGAHPARKGIGGGLSNFRQEGPHSSGHLLQKRGILR